MSQRYVKRLSLQDYPPDAYATKQQRHLFLLLAVWSLSFPKGDTKR